MNIFSTQNYFSKKDIVFKFNPEKINNDLTIKDLKKDEIYNKTNNFLSKEINDVIDYFNSKEIINYPTSIKDSFAEINSLFNILHSEKNFKAFLFYVPIDYIKWQSSCSTWQSYDINYFGNEVNVEPFIKYKSMRQEPNISYAPEITNIIKYCTGKKYNLIYANIKDEYFFPIFYISTKILEKGETLVLSIDKFSSRFPQFIALLTLFFDVYIHRAIIENIGSTKIFIIAKNYKPQKINLDKYLEYNGDYFLLNNDFINYIYNIIIKIINKIIDIYSDKYLKFSMIDKYLIEKIFIIPKHQEFIKIEKLQQYDVSREIQKYIKFSENLQENINLFYSTNQIVEGYPISLLPKFNKIEYNLSIIRENGEFFIKCNSKNLIIDTQIISNEWIFNILLPYEAFFLRSFNRIEVINYLLSSKNFIERIFIILLRYKLFEIDIFDENLDKEAIYITNIFISTSKPYFSMFPDIELSSSGNFIHQNCYSSIYKDNQEFIIFLENKDLTKYYIKKIMELKEIYNNSEKIFWFYGSDFDDELPINNRISKIEKGLNIYGIKI